MFVSAIVSAQNEAPRVGRVLEVLTTYPGFGEVILVDDGSVDDTRRVAEEFPVRVIRSDRNCGKGGAMEIGVCAARGAVLFFCDADIRGLTHKMIQETVEPVVLGCYDMSIAARKSKIRHVGFGILFSPLIDGQRAVRRELWDAIPAHYKRGYGIEVALNHFGARSARGFTYTHYDITQVPKEKKYGYVRGRLARYRMYRDIAHAKARLLLERP